MVCEKTHVDGLLFKVAEAEEFVELLVCTVIHDFLPGPGQAVDDVHDDGWSFTETFGLDRYDIFVRHPLCDLSVRKPM